MGEARRKLAKRDNALLACAGVQTVAGKVQVSWETASAATPLGQLAYFIEFLNLTGLWATWVESAPLAYASPNAPSKADVLGTWMVSILAGHRRYAHVTAIRGDGVNPGLLGMTKVVSEDALRRGLEKIDETAGVAWLRDHLERSVLPLLKAPWILDIDTTVKVLYGKQAVAGLVWRKDGKVVRNVSRPILRDLDKFPYPDRTTLPIDYIESLPLDVPAVLSLQKFCTMQTSRGCPYTCIDCDIPALADGKWRFRSPEHVLGEMKQLNEMGYRSIYLTDDHFLLKRDRISKICQNIIDHKLQFKWGCEGRVDSVAVDQLPIMGKANCNFLAFGVEGGTQRILDRLDKRQTLPQIEHAVSEAKKHGIERAHGFFLVGSPGETVEDILESFRFCARLKLDKQACYHHIDPDYRPVREREE